MLAIASRLEIVDYQRRQTDPIVSISIRLGTGNPNSGVWELERPRVEDAFIEREGDSLSVRPGFAISQSCCGFRRVAGPRPR